MDRLILLRHGKAKPDSETGDDFDRRLARRGVAESEAAGARLAEMGFRPDVAVVSTAARARATWEAASGAFPGVEVRFDVDLYHAEPETIRRLALAAGIDCATVMVVGHNPGMQELTVSLLKEGLAPAGLIARAQRDFPTGAASVFLFDSFGRPHYDGLFFPDR